MINMVLFKSRKQKVEQAKDIVKQRKKFEKEQTILKQAGKTTRKRVSAIKQSAQQFAAVGRKPIDMTFEQEAMTQIMGGGRMGSIWGANDAIHINHDLNPRMRGDTGTADVFGLNKPQSFQGGDPETRSMFGL